MSTETVPKLLTAQEVARRLDVPSARVRDLARRNMLPYVRLGRQLRFDPQRLENWIAQGGQPLPENQ